MNVANVWLNFLRNVSPTPPAGLWFKLHIGDPGSAGAANAAVGDASRKTAAYAAASAGSIAQSASAGPWTNVSTSETLSHISVWDASTAGNFLYSFALGSTQAWANTNTFTITSYSVSLTPIAA